MSLRFSEKQIQREITNLKRANDYTWESVISERLDNNLRLFSKNLSEIVKSLSNKNPVSVFRRLQW